MIVTSTTPFTPEQIAQVKEQFGVYVKTVIDIQKKVCGAGMDRHFEGETILLAAGSHQSDIWGGGIDLETKEIDFIQSESIKKTFTDMTTYFLKIIL